MKLGLPAWSRALLLAHRLASSRNGLITARRTGSGQRSSAQEKLDSASCSRGAGAPSPVWIP